MSVCIFEDPGVLGLDPLTLTRPAFELLCGASSLFDRQCKTFSANEVGVLVRPELADLTRLQRAGIAVNDEDWMRRKSKVLVNARWLPPPAALTDLTTARVGCVGDEVAYVLLSGVGISELTFDSAPAALARLKQSLPCCDAGGVLMEHAWDLMEHNPQALREDARLLVDRCKPDKRVTVIGPAEQLFVDPSTVIDPFVVADTRQGPVILDRNVTVHSFSRLEGPCYVGPESIVLGAKLRGGTFGPKCRIGGEVEGSIMQGYSNKYHDGFLGHSYIGEWVNLAAGTQTSDLRNDYGPINVRLNGERIVTGRNKIGSFIGDHTKTGLNAILNCGTMAGAFCSLISTGTYLPNSIPSFTFCDERMTEQWDLRKLFQTAAIAMSRRSCELTATHKKLYSTLFEETAAIRKRLHDEHETRQNRS